MATALALNPEVSPVVQEICDRMGALNVGQVFISEWIGCSQGDLSKILAGVRQPTVERIEQIKLTLDDLEAVKRAMRPMKIVWDVESVRIFVNEFVRKPQAGQELQKSLERLRGGFDALGGK